MEKLKIGVVGATGIVGQNYIKLLQGHPWFEIIDISASPRSAGKTYQEAAGSKWQMPIPIPNNIKDLVVRDVQDFDSVPEDLSFVFSAINMPTKDQIREVEFKYARNDIPVVSNNSAHRWTPDVPMIIGEVNSHHSKVIPIQQKRRGFSKGFVSVKPNCSIQSYVTPIYALEQAGFKVDKIITTTLQAVSGAGYPGVPSLDMIDNIVPYIGGEEEKSEKEPLKIFGKVTEDGIKNDDSIEISATCTRVSVIDGHTASINLKFKDKIPKKEEIIQIWNEFRAVPQELDLPFAPKQPIIYLEDDDRPQPRKDRDNDKGMAVTVGRLRKDNIFDYKFLGLSHNTIRGAAGGAILNAELLKARGYLK
ncbi:MAG: aspartate-semialdehyde dehydrogenase [Candidatus Lokiarchaeota archaeon]|nr:aspartate-semialdehyde dehydrogenase [Candidatus Lokiarchaeota archaeon]MBD3198406.1 aspartate-semialdehyde dehydrogenase [Candidatus Lokiarchaeota archaeon]